GSNALCFYQNAIDYSVAAGAREGDPVSFVQTYPETPWMHTANYGVTGPAGSGNSLYLYTTDLAPYAQLRGVYGLDRKPKTEHFANKYGDLTCAYYFWKNLKETGWEVTGEYAQVERSGRISGPDFIQNDLAGKPVEIGYTESPTLSEIARITNWNSDNFYAESMMRAMGEIATTVASYDSCRVAVYEVLAGLGMPLEEIRLADGCGLSRMNYLSATWITDYLQAMLHSPAAGAFLASLPAPGQGTLNMIRIKGGERIRMKSGSMDGVLCYSGYILDAGGAPAYTFSILTNNATAPVKEVRPVLVRFLEFLLSL
ncbi:MAG: D-alanyl-D-alanine carboxypeptidase, partial [Bacteroidales bacterium]|nr:D-alanyl-D-alanine carboxypeptidase [Bacteroidales bacterium]